MTGLSVFELRERLLAFPPDLRVVAEDTDGDRFHFELVQDTGLLVLVSSVQVGFEEA